ncbi:MAG: ABC transporter substrate-binding protein [Dehalococcoidia bacterium]|nr:ABC transporter substrate-binding protein [Dehalococcoidia bacterium]
MGNWSVVVPGWWASSLVGGAMLLTAAGCQSPQAPGGGGGGDTGGGGPAKPKVERLVFVTEPPAREINETRNLSTPNAWQYTPMYESLLGVDENTGKRTPALATEWKVGTDGSSYEFTLRRGVKFHTETAGVKGEWGEFTAKDLIQPFTEISKRDSISGVTAMWWGAVKEVRAVADDKAIIQLSRPDANFLDYVSDQLGGYEIWSTKAFEQLGPPTDLTKPALPGTGPYMYNGRAQGQYIRYKKVPYQHWKATPDFSEFEFRFVKEASTRMASLLAGEAHMAPVPEDLLKQAEKQGFKLMTGNVPAYRVFAAHQCCAMKDANDPNSGWRDPAAALTNVKVRKALNKAVNKDELNKAFFGGKGQPLFNNPLNPSREAWDKSWETRYKDEYGFDQAAARRLLQEAGYGPGNAANVSITVGVPATGLPASDDIAESLAQYWRGVGVNVTLEQIDSASYTNKTRAYELTNHARVNGTSSNAWVGITQFGSTAGTPSGSGPQQPEADVLLKQLQTTLDEKRIGEIWQKVGEELYTGHHFVSLFWLPTEVAVDPKVVGSWNYSGSISGSWTHIWNIKAAK